MQRISITNPQNIIDGTAKKYYFKLRNTGGPKGDKGDKGDTGATGPQGPQGNAATVSVGSTTTLPVGYDATVTNSGSIYNAVLDFGIPQGPQGPQGAKGDKGDTGAKGDTGPRGPQGERGTNATVYVGTTSTLNPGSQATVYNSGTDSNAVLNFGIPKGEKGDTGATGATGATGPAGQNFTPTIVAELPATGDESKLYLTPKAHTTSTATGNPVTASVTEQAGQMESFQLDGDTAQQTYDGRNLVGLAGITFPYTLSGVTITRETDGSFTFNGTLTATTNFYLSPWANQETYNSLLPYVGQTVTLSCEISGSVTDLDFRNYGLKRIGGDTFINSSMTNPRTATFTMSDNTTVLGIRLGGGTFTNWNIKIQLELGSTATAYEPYVGGQASPSPDYPQTIQTVTGEQTVEIVGKNLFNKNDVVNGIPSASDGSIISASSVARTSDYIPVVPSTAYSHTGHPAGWAVVAWYKSDKSFIERTDNATTTTSPNEAAYARVSCAQNDLGNCQFEIGQPTAYTPYSKQTLPINLGKNLFDNTGWRKGQYNNGEWVDNLVARATTPLIPIEPTTYTISLNSESLDTSLININYFDSSKNWLGNRSTLGLPPFGTVSREQTFTLPQGASYLAITIRPYGEDGVNIQGLAQSSLLMLEKGSSKTSYAPYFTPIELCKLGTYHDYIYKDGENWKVHKKILKTIFENNSGWDWDSSVPRLAYNTANLHIILPPNQRTNAYGLSNKYVARSFEYVYTNKNAGFALSQSGFLSCVDKSWTSEAQAKATIAGTVFYFALQDAFVTDNIITDTTLIAQLEAIRTASLQNGTNTITNSTPAPSLAGDMEIGYYGYNPTNRYDKFIWLDINNAYEQLNSPDTSSTLSTLSTRSLGTTTEQPTVTRSLDTETITLKKGEAEPIEDKTELPTILDDSTEEAEETETTEPEESDGTDER